MIKEDRDATLAPGVEVWSRPLPPQPCQRPDHQAHARTYNDAHRDAGCTGYGNSDGDPCARAQSDT